MAMTVIASPGPLGARQFWLLQLGLVIHARHVST
jgi:hypothetical protein